MQLPCRHGDRCGVTKRGHGLRGVGGSRDKGQRSRQYAHYASNGH